MAEEPTTEAAAPADLAPINLNVEIPSDLLVGCATELQLPVQRVAPVLARFLGALVVRGLGIRVGAPTPPTQAPGPGILVARGMPQLPIPGQHGLRS